MFSHLLPDKHALLDFKYSLTSHITTTLQGSASAGLSYLESPLGQIIPSSEDEVQLLVIGGTRTVSAVYSKSQKLVFQETHLPTPVLHNKEDLLGIIHKTYKNQSSLVLNFAFPITPIKDNDTLDGRLLRGTKQHALQGIIGERVGETIKRYIFETFSVDCTVMVVNDITSLLNSHYYKGIYIAGIVGTGCNFGVVHRGKSINLEIGNFNDFEVAEEVLDLDQHSQNPNEQLWEKSISGKYLKDHFNYWANRYGVEETITSSHNLQKVTTEKGILLSEIILRKSASKTAATLAALKHVTNSRRVIIEGGVFWDAYNYYNYVLDYLDILGDGDVECIQSYRPFNNLVSFIE